MTGATDIGTSKLASKTDLANLKTQVDNLNVEKPKALAADLSKLNNVVDNDVVRKIMLISWLPKSLLLILRYQALTH